MPELKPCPFCGENTEARKKSGSKYPPSDEFYIFCETCYNTKDITADGKKAGSCAKNKNGAG